MKSRCLVLLYDKDKLARFLNLFSVIALAGIDNIKIIGKASKK
jgi:hypothetical protein